MNAINLNRRDNKKNIFKIVEEYRKLIRLSSPSDIELKRMEKIMELAIYDAELNNLINREDEQYATENNLLADDYFDEKEFSIIELDYPSSLSKINDKDNPDEVKDKSEDSFQKLENTSNVVLFPRLVTSHPEKKIKILGCNIRLVISSFVAGGMLTCFGITELHNSFNSGKDFLLKHTSIPSQYNANYLMQHKDDYSVSHINNTEEMSVCNSNSGKPNQKIEEYYAEFKKLETQIETQQLQASEIKSEVRELQR
ncbi:MAG: hypothetical protein HC815_38200, partial [Richelia sp. RM1_1_1]|nr:hypothetical protein [Richelia sp. RM1_1_1]